MAKVKFLQDFQGSETREVFYRKSQEVELPDSMAARLVADRRAEFVDNPVVLENVNEVQVEYHDLEPQFENAAEPPKPKSKRKK